MREWDEALDAALPDEELAELGYDRSKGVFRGVVVA